MQKLRNARLITRLALVWFALFIGAAIASPLIKPQAMELICSGSGVMKVLFKNEDGSSTEVASRMLDCPLCASVSAPPPMSGTVAEAVQPLAFVLQAISSAPVAALMAAPMPARGPPAFFISY